MRRAPFLIRRIADRAWFARAMLVNAGAWLLIALMFAGQGVLVAAVHGAPQPWWPSLGYSAAIFSIWALQTPFVALAADQIEGRIAAWPWRLLLHVAGLPVACAIHVGLFSMLFWQVYADPLRVPTRVAFANTMFVRNLDIDSLLYTAIVTGVIVWRRRRESVPARVHAPSPPQPLRARVPGGIRIIALDTIDWIAAAGDYAEVHAGQRVELVDESLAALAERLPSEAFARIHRGAIVRRDRVVEVRSAGRGDALVRMADGHELRLSRRYRANLLPDRSRRADAAIPLGETL
jgi:two-component system LytT family response regulator